MSDQNILFNIQGQIAVITGGSGVLGRTMALGLARAGAKVVVIGRRAETSARVAGEIRNQGGEATGIACDVTDRAALERAREESERTFGPVDILVNAAGGNLPQAITSAERSFFALTEEAIDDTIRLNFTGTLLACQVFGHSMAERKQGCIVNIASMTTLRPLTRTVAYSAAKAAIGNFTQWLAVHMAREYSPQIRVNAIAPGFFLTEQNRAILTDVASGALTP
ncbi:MAG TPA: SDR family NAD(P)-dependent oxidoreductase, partial [Ktedonobacteraceae bacterium]|nr:SDR family NAD(P)-dependent oxidoreductase [Ktedonobacteraceae bacterium]